jgi:hypothetical protein
VLSRIQRDLIRYKESRVFLPALLIITMRAIRPGSCNFSVNFGERGYFPKTSSEGAVCLLYGLVCDILYGWHGDR